METVLTTVSGLMGSCAADFFSGTPTHAAEPSSARIAKLRQEFNSLTPLTPPPDFNATVAPAEQLADLQHPDAEHLLLGINLEGLREACELVGFPFRCYTGGRRVDAWKITYKRKDHPEMAWLNEAYRSEFGPLSYLGYDFCCAVKTWLKANGHENESICQVLLKRGSKNVRPANLFYSHTQGVWLPETIRRMREGIEAHKGQLPSTDESQLFFWLDYTTLKQCVHDFDLSRVRQLIKEIGLTLAELDFDLQTYLTRSFCILELFASVDAGATLLVQMHFLKAFDVAAELAANDPGDRPHAGGARHRPADLSHALVLHSRAAGYRPGRRQTARADALPQSVRRGGRARGEAGRRQGGGDAQGGGQGHDRRLRGGDVGWLRDAQRDDHRGHPEGGGGHRRAVQRLGYRPFRQGPAGARRDGGGRDPQVQHERVDGPPELQQGGRRRGRQGAGGGAQGERDGEGALPRRLRHRRRWGGGARRGAPLSNTTLSKLWLQGNDGIGEQGKQLLSDAVAGRQGFELGL